MTTKGMTKPRQPLTREQQVTVVKWRALGIKYMLHALRKRGLEHFNDEAEGLAHEALMEAVRVWEPKRGAFASCLKWWIRNAADLFSAHGARTVHQSGHAVEHVDAWSLDAPVRMNNHSGLEQLTTWMDLLPDDSLHEPSEAVDIRRLTRAIPLVMAERLTRHAKNRNAREYAEDSVSIWWERQQAEEFGEIPLEAFAHILGVSRQRVSQREAMVQKEFEKWAREIREEAA